MKSILSLLLTNLACIIAYTQNMVPNPGFEDTLDVVCGIFSSPGDVATSVSNWYSPTTATPMIWSTELDPACYNHQPYTTYPGPIGWKGSQMPLTGNVMASLWCYTIPTFDQRQYLQVKLISPMVPGYGYCIDIHASLADNSEKYINHFGALFSMTPITRSDDKVITEVPQADWTMPVSDTMGWTNIELFYTPDQAYEYLTIGNFSIDASTTTYTNPGGSGGPGNYGATLFIDSVTVEYCTLSRWNENAPLNARIYPNPSGDQLNIETDPGLPTAISILSADGRNIIADQKLEGEIYAFDVSSLPAGLYMVRLIRGSQSGCWKWVKE